MLRLISLLRRADGMSKEQFRTWVHDKHVLLARRLPGRRAYAAAHASKRVHPVAAE